MARIISANNKLSYFNVFEVGIQNLENDFSIANKP